MRAVRSLILAFAATVLSLSGNPISEGCGFFNTNNFGAYKCGTKNGYESTLIQINNTNGTAICEYHNGTGDIISERVTTGCAIPRQNSAKSKVKLTDGSINSAAKTIAAGAGRDADAYSTVGLRKDITDVLKEMNTGDNKGGFAGSAVNKDLKKINSHTNYEGTVPSILTGVLTLDGDVFEKTDGKVQYINEVGEISINPRLIEVTDSVGWGGQTWTKLKNFFSGSNGDGTDSYNTFNPMRFMDLQVLGFYVYLAENMISGYMDIVYIVFMLGAMYGSGIYSYKKFISKTSGSDDFRVNKMTYMLTAAAGFTFFTAPVLHENVNTTGAIAKAIYKSDSGYYDTGNSYGYSTLAQESIRYSAQAGTYFANLESDYAMQAFLALIQFKQGMFADPKQVGGSIDARLQSIEAELTAASFDSNYVEKICKPYFGLDNFDITQDKAQALQSSTKNTASLENQGISATRIDITECISKYKQIKANADSVIASKKSLAKEVDTYKALYVGAEGGVSGLINTVLGNSDKDKYRAMGDYLNMMVWTQNTFGWIASITPHTSYLFFKQVDVFEYELDEDELKENFADGLINKQKEDGERLESVAQASGDFIEGAVAATLGPVISNSVWFIVPGFDGIYKFFDSKLSKLVVDKDGKPTVGGRFLRKTVAGTIGKVKFVGDMMTSVFDTIDRLTGDKTALLNTIVAIISFFLAMAVVTMMIATITVMTVTIFLTFKIVMYFIELIVFFMSAPVIGIYATIMSEQPQQYMASFMRHLGMLIVSPLLIVSASYIVLPITELFKGLFNALVTLVFKIFDKSESLLNQDTPMTSIIDSLQKILALSSMQGVAEIFSMVSTIFVSYIIIFNYKEWFTKMIGLENMTDNTKSAVSEMKQDSNKYISPL